MKAAQNNPRPIVFICLLTQVETQVHDSGANSATLGPNARMLTAFAKQFQTSKPNGFPANVCRAASLTKRIPSRLFPLHYLVVLI